MKNIALATVLAVLPLLGFAHPHTSVDQQAALTVGHNGLSVQITILPSHAEGPAIFAALDGDGDGALSEVEMRAFAEDLLSDTALSVDGDTRALALVEVTLVSRTGIEAGTEPIVMTAEAEGAFDASEAGKVALSVGYTALSHDWTVQPWFASDVLFDGQTPRILRESGNAAVTISFPGT